MKFIFVLAVTLVAVSGKSLPNNDLAKQTEKIKEEAKAINDILKADPHRAALESVKFLAEIDADVASEIFKHTDRTGAVMADTNKTLEERFLQMADINQDMAGLWKQAAIKYSETNATALQEAENIQNFRQRVMKIKANAQSPKASVEDTLKFVSAIDADIWSLMLKDTQQAAAVLVDTNKALKEKYTETAELAQHTADLWKLAAKKRIEGSKNVTGAPASVTAK